MAEQCFPYNSVGGDRKYKAEDFRSYFALFIGNGVFYKNSDSLKVTENSGMTVSVKAGSAWIDGTGYKNTSALSITLDTADGALSRIDRIVVRNDYTNRKTYIAVKKGSYSAQPTAQALTRNADVYELGIADVLVSGGVVNITQSAITDTRLNNDLCGIVTALIEQADTTEIFSQFEAYFDEFTATYVSDMEGWTQQQQNEYTAWADEQKEEFEAWVEEIRGILDDTAAGNLQNEIEEETQRAAMDAFMRYYNLTAQTTEFKPDKSIVTVNEEATITTVFGTDESGHKTITETIVPNAGELGYRKVTTIIPASGAENKKISEVYTGYELQ